MSLEHPYQRSSLRCSEGRGGTIFFNQYTGFSRLHPITNIMLTCIELRSIQYNEFQFRYTSGYTFDLFVLSLAIIIL